MTLKTYKKSLYEDLILGKISQETKDKMKHMGERMTTAKEVKDKQARHTRVSKKGKPFFAGQGSNVKEL